ncbi:dynamin family protein, partial [Staphylococcus felis]
MINQNELDILYKLKKEVEKSDHQSLVTMINQIIKKVYLNHYTLTFVGHFSAGKSTLINNLIERDILPSSPVPTTSNTALVSVSNEEGITANLEGQKYSVLENYDAVKQMNRENYHVESIDIRFKSNLYHDGLTFQDTPGVDSNVKSHSISTESFLYTSNIVFYTVDYN